MRSVPPALATHLAQPVTTTCRLLRFNLTNGQSYGMTNLDRDVEYDGVTYSAMNGFNSSVIASDASYDVDNAEAYALLSANIPGITLEMVRRGELDDAHWVMYLVNYEDLSMGHILLDAGDVGEVNISKETVYMPELLSYAMRLRNAVGHVDSRACRAVFGNMDLQSQLGCGVSVNTLWTNSTVTNVDTEEGGRVFAGDNLDLVTNVVPGRVEWLTGNNASSRLYQVEFFVDGTIKLFEPLPFAVELGDTFRIRPDCDKNYQTCRDRWNNLINFKGEPLIPTNDGSASQTPGVSI